MRAPAVGPLARPHRARHGADTASSRRSTGCRPWSTSPAAPKDDEPQDPDPEGRYPGIVKTTLDGVDQRDYLLGEADAVGPRRPSSTTPARTRRRCGTELEVVLRDGDPLAGRLRPDVQPYHWTQVVNIKRDPFETSIGSDQKTLFGTGRRARRTGHRLRLRLEHAADRPAAVAEGTRELPLDSRRCRTRPATIWSRSSRQVEEACDEHQGPRQPLILRIRGARRPAPPRLAGFKSKDISYDSCSPAALPSPGRPVPPQVGAKLGFLTCKLKDVQNVYRHKPTRDCACAFKPKSGKAESYSGQITSVGLDLSVTKEMTLVWGVLAPTAHAGDAAFPQRNLCRRVRCGGGRCRCRRERARRRRRELHYAAADQLQPNGRQRCLARDRGIPARLTTPFRVSHPNKA